MNTYLKYKPVWYRIFVMGSLIFGGSLILGIIGLYAVSSFTGIPLMDFQNPDFSDPRVITAHKILLPINSLAVFLIPSLLYAYFADPRPARFLRLDTKPSWLFWIIAGVIMILAMPSAFWLGELNKNLDISPLLPDLDRWMKDTEASNNKVIEAIIGKQTIGGLLINLLIMAVVPAISEEFFFRGLIQKGITRLTRHVWSGILLSAFIFSAFHMQFLTFLTRFEMGILLGVLFWYSGSLWVPIIAHFIFNGIQVLAAYMNPELEKNPAPIISAEIVGLSFLIITALVIIMRKKSTVTMSEVYDDDDDDLTILPKEEYTD